MIKDKRAGRKGMIMKEAQINYKDVPGLYRIIPLVPLRQTPDVAFDAIPTDVFPHIDGLDRVIHSGAAQSPPPVGEVVSPWYMHPHQDDHLVVLHGRRISDLFTAEHGRMESFEVSPEAIRQGDRIIFDGPAILAWPRGVFHRVRTCPGGSASLNFAVRYPGFDMKTNFSIYDLNTESGDYHVVREGFLDQP